MRIVDRRGHEVFEEEGRWTLLEGEVYRLAFADGVKVLRCRVGPRELKRDAEGAFELRADHSVGLDELVVELEGHRSRHSVEFLASAQKLGADAWSALVLELADWLPGVLAGISASAEGSVVQGGVPAGIVAAAVAPLVPELIRAVEVVLRSPKELETQRPEDRRMHTVRRVSPTTLRWLAHHAEAVAAVEGAEFSGDPWVPSRVTDVSRDHPANRAVRWYVERVAKLLETVADALRRAASHQFDDIASWCTSQASVMEAHVERLRSLVARSFLAAVPAEPPSQSALLTLADEPIYARVLRLARAILAATFSDARGEGAPVPVRASFELYELWCLLALQRALDEVLGEAPWKVLGRGDHPLLAHNLQGLTLRRALPEGTLEIRYNLTFRSYLVAPEGDQVALTGERRPDFVVTWSPREGAPAWLVLDAKYRVSLPSVREAFPSLHVYRDGLRWRSFGGRPRCGLLLVPEIATECAGWAVDTFHSRHGFGLWRLRPGANADKALGQWIIDALGCAPREGPGGP